MAHDEETLKIASATLSLEVAPLGAEMRNLRDGEGRSLQWDGDPAVWSGRAPLLFPIVGNLAGGRYRLDGHEFAMARHGFARVSRFEVISHDARSAVLRLSASDATRAIYPFAFELDVAYALDDVGLRMTATIRNLGDTAMPASFGWHPAFRWPLPYGAARADHALRFDHDEPAPVRRLDGDGLLSPEPRPTPVRGATLALDDGLFVDDALILDRLQSRRLRYGAAAGPSLVVDFADCPQLGVWTKPGAGFVCIEPWHGVADPSGFDGDLRDKPAMMTIAAGDSTVLEIRVRVE